MVVVFELRKGSSPGMACEVIHKAVCASIGVRPSRIVAASEGEVCRALNGKLQRRATRDSLLGDRLNILYDQVYYKPIEESSTVELGIEIEETELSLRVNPLCIESGAATTETPSVSETDALKIALNTEVRENLILNFLTNTAQKILRKPVDAHTPLMEAGFNALDLAECVIRIQGDLIAPSGSQLQLTNVDVHQLITLHSFARALLKSSEKCSHSILDSTMNIEIYCKEDSLGQADVLDMDCHFPGWSSSPEELWPNVWAPTKGCSGMSPPGQLHLFSGTASPGMPIVPRPTEMRLLIPASLQQATMYAGDHLVASSARSNYNAMIQFGAVGKLDVEALKMALAFLWRRHQVLRTTLILQVPQFPGLFYMTVTKVLYD